ncbi:PilZ domain-containing protein [Thiolapillus sp.]
MHKRAHDRFSPRSTVQVINSLDGTSVGVLVNISSAGFMIVSEGTHPSPGSIHQLQLIDHKHGDPDITLGATCLWQDEASASDSYWCGFQIIDISAQDQAKLNGYIDSLAKAL